MPETILNKIGMYEKLKILSDAAKYNVSCTSSGVDRNGDGTGSVTVFRQTEDAFPC